MKKILLLVTALATAICAMAADLTVYFVNHDGWETVNAYAWNPEPNDSWPGVAATLTEETCKDATVYSFVVDFEKTTQIIFNNGSSKTDDLDINPDKPYFYRGSWFASLAEIEGAEIVTYDYYIAGEKVDGTEWVCGKNWSPSGCGLANNTITYTALPAGEYKFKITNGAWPNADGTGGTCWGYEALSTTLSEISSTDDGNIVITLTSAADVTISFDGSSISVSINGEEGGEEGGEGGEEGGDDPIVTPTGADYYLIGYINGADYGDKDDYQNLGDYKFVDGSLVATFEANSYVAIKTGDLSKWYFAEAYTEETSVTLEAGKDFGEKLFVPGGVELTFTLVENGDGSLTLSYTTGTATDLEDVDAEDAVVAAYDLLGRPVAADAAGYVILQYASGKAVKVFNN